MLNLVHPDGIVIPKGARDKFKLSGGQRLIVLSDDMGIAFLPAEQFEEKMRNTMDMMHSLCREKETVNEKSYCLSRFVTGYNSFIKRQEDDHTEIHYFPGQRICIA